MALFRKKADPISDRARALSVEIAALEAEIKTLGTQANPRFRSTAQPHGLEIPHPAASAVEPVFEPVNHHRMNGTPKAEAANNHVNDLGVRKFDLAGAWQRLRNQFSGGPVSNPKLINYLAAGSIQGLRPLRYEKRVARNRVIALTAILFIFLWGILATLLKR